MPTNSPWVYPQEVRQELPNAGRGVTESQLSKFVSEGEDMTVLGDTSATSTTLGKRAVKAYAKTEALKVMRSKGDPISTEEIRLSEEAADRFASAYRLSTSTTTDDSASNYKGVVSSTPW
jgi:hypothetical protein